MSDARRIDWIVVHTAAAYDTARRRVIYQSVEDLRRYHIESNGWRDIGYHWVVEENGAVMPGRPESEPGAHVGGFNAHTLGICVTGHGDFAPFTALQLGALVRLAARLCREHKLTGLRVIGHREAPQHGAPPTAKTCPGVLIDMNEIRRLVGDRIDAGAAE